MIIWPMKTMYNVVFPLSASTHKMISLFASPCNRQLYISYANVYLLYHEGGNHGNRDLFPPDIISSVMDDS